MFRHPPISHLHYITNPTDCDYINRILPQVLNAGVNWVQLRMKNSDEQAMLEMALETQKLCRMFNATFIINDHVLLAKDIKAHGVHLGNTDMPPEKARKKLGDNYIIGGTANTFNDIKQLAPFVNYIGLGPYKYTATKQNLSPVLGYDGLFKILVKCGTEGIYTPIVVIGGIMPEDIPTLHQLDIYRFAVSSGIDKSDDIVIAVKNYFKYIG